MNIRHTAINFKIKVVLSIFSLIIFGINKLIIVAYKKTKKGCIELTPETNETGPSESAI